MISALLAAMQSWVVRRTGSTAIAADRTHYLMDAALNAALSRRTGGDKPDRMAAGGSGICRRHSRIHDRGRAARRVDGVPSTARSRIAASAARAHQADCRSRAAACARIHDLRTRDAGDRVFIEFHLEVDGHVSIDEGHGIVDAAEHAIVELFPKQTEVIGHVEPAGIADQRLDDRVQ